MKTMISLVAAVAFSCGAVSMFDQNSIADDGDLVSVLRPATDIADSVVQDEPAAVPPAPAVAPVQEAPPVPGANEPVQDQLAPVEPVIEGPALIMDSVLIEQPFLSAPGNGCQSCCNDPCGCCQPCCEQPCCCPPTPTVFCLVDPCGCSHEACIEVPACCVNEQPEVTWRGGLFGRQVAIVCWECCGHRVKVIVTRRGKVKVRG